MLVYILPWFTTKFLSNIVSETVKRTNISTTNISLAAKLQAKDFENFNIMASPVTWSYSLWAIILQSTEWTNFQIIFFHATNFKLQYRSN